MGGWWRWALVSSDGVAPSRMVGVFASVDLPLHHKVQKFLFWHRLTRVVPEKGRKTIVVWVWSGVFDHRVCDMWSVWCQAYSYLPSCRTLPLGRNSSLRHSSMARVNEGSQHSFTCHPHVYPQVEWTIPAFTSQLQSVTTLWPVLIFCPAEGRRLSWPEGRRLSWPE